MTLTLILFFPLLAALLTYFSGKQFAPKVAFGLSLVNVLLTVCALAQVKQSGVISLTHEWIAEPHILFSLVADGLSIWLLVLTNFLIPVILLSSFKKQFANANLFYALVLAMQFGLNGVFLAGDGFLFYVFWELALLPIYFIVWLWSENENAEIRTRTAFKFFLYTIAGSLFMLFGFMYLYAKVGSLVPSDLYNASFSQTEQILLFLCFFAAFAVKIPIFPFHTWQADTYREAPTVGTMLLAGIMLKMGLYALLRWLIPVFPQGTDFWMPYIVVLCAIGVIYGAVIAIRQDNLKNLLAFSSLSHVGLIALGSFVYTNAGVQGSIVQMLAHGVNVVGAFFIGEIILQRTGTLSISELGGIRTVAPKFFTASIIIVLASVGLPLTNGFVGEFLLLFSAFQYNTWLAVIAGLTIILGAVYLLKMVQNVFLGETTERTKNFADLTTSETIVFALLIVAIFVFGVYPKLVFDIAQPYIETLILK
ncbi:MAG TPA: NADH-quinone oxidoreductase subunit M [Chitinophagales bacterium]